ncbi:MAG: A/G-specific adenine glycosylase, partial [Methanomicrobiales archaeon]|nr:A/G-specific adenine glycosylase [Methanomicrobiales archaeon]
VYGITPSVIADFQSMICTYYRTYRRILPWRGTSDPYHILVSEIMLQQTQVPRVEAIYPLFIQRFPQFSSLAHAPLEEILQVWKGLGYNRRAIALKKIAQRVLREHNGSLPHDPAVLSTFPGIGPATARSIVTFAFNEPVVFLETNIRTVFISVFFPDAPRVHDREILPLVEKTLLTEHPREWYSALMDYGARLKKEESNYGRKSATHHPQPRFEGSDRQVRGTILKILLQQPSMPADNLRERTALSDERLKKILQDLEREGFVHIENGMVRFAEG